MANTRRELKPYKGYPITKINGYMYVTFDLTHGKIVCYSLDEIKKRIDGVIGVNGLAKHLGKILLPH